jgi:hypothetical protein
VLVLLLQAFAQLIATAVQAFFIEKNIFILSLYEE